MNLKQWLIGTLPATVRPLGPAPADPLALGRWGEEAAARFLKNHRFKILYRNFRAPGGGEVDLICRDRAEATLVFVEVKTRRSELYGRPSDAVDAKKQRLILRGAMAWLRMLDMPDITFRFDIVEILAQNPPEYTHIRSAFALPDHYIY